MFAVSTASLRGSDCLNVHGAMICREYTPFHKSALTLIVKIDFFLVNIDNLGSSFVLQKNRKTDSDSRRIEFERADMFQMNHFLVKNVPSSSRFTQKFVLLLDSDYL